MVFNFLRLLEANVTKEQFVEILNESDKYIKSTRIILEKRTGTAAYIYICLNFTWMILNKTRLDNYYKK